MPRLRSGLEIGGSTETMVPACSKSSPITPVKDKVDLEMAELECEFKRYSDKANSTSELYLNLLIKSYQEQIATLKEELKEKNNVIYDILYATSTAARRNQTIKMDDNLSIAKSMEIPVLHDTNANAIANAEVNNSIKWTIPRKTSRDTKQIDVGIQVKNRYSSLAENEWLNYEDSEGESVFDHDCTTPSDNVEGNRITEVKRKPAVITEEDPEKNTYAPFRRSPTTQRRHSEKRTVAILGDSMIRNIHYRELSKSCKNQKIYVKAFPGADIADMTHYVLPTAKRDPDAIILHCGTNSLQKHDDPTEVAQELAKLACSLKNERNAVVISSIICRSDDQREKVDKVNEALYTLCQEHSLALIENSNIQEEHLSTRGRFPGLHLNDAGNQILFSNIVNTINM